MRTALFIPVSRTWETENIIPDDMLKRAMDIADLTVILEDTNDPEIFEFDHGSERVIVTGTEPLPDDAPVMLRRQRVISNWERFKAVLPQDIDYVISFEDDTTFDPYFFQEWIGMMESDKDIQYVEGAECHRRGARAIGAWKVGDDRIHTLLPSNSLLQPITGGGFYGFATRADNIRQATFREAGPHMGPDVCFVNDTLKRTGGKAFIDWRCECRHWTGPDTFILPSDADQIIAYDMVGGKWQGSIITSK